MIRRSKIKVRPAIKKPSSQGSTPSRPSLQKSSDGYPSLSAQDKALAASELNVAAHATPPASDSDNTSATENSVAPLTTDNNGKLSQPAKKAGDSELADDSSGGSANSKTIAKPQMARRRKLVACPTMARKRAKILNPEMMKTDAQNASICAPKEPGIAAFPNHENSWASGSLQFENVTLPAPLKPNVTETGNGIVDESSSTQFATLSTVTSISLIEDKMVGNNSNDETCDINNATTVILNATISSSETYETRDHGELSHPPAENADTEAQIIEKEKQPNVIEMCLPRVQNENRKLDIPQNNAVKKTTTKSKSLSTTMKHRNSAMAKLKKLKEGQEDSEKWPELDQNVVSMSDLIFLNPPNTVGLKLGMNVRREDAEREKTQREKTPEPEPSTSTQEEEDSALPVPQIRIAEDGSVVIDEESLVVDTRKPPQRTAHDTVYEIGREGMVNQCSFLRRPHARPARWSQQETDKFYRCLCIVGAEFTLMGAMFGGRSADDLRRKFKRERKLNPSRVDNALMQQHLSKWTDDMFEPKGMDNSNKGINVTRPAEETVK